MMVPGSINPLLMGGNADPLDEYMVIGHSVRFNSADSPSLARTTAASGGDRDKWFVFLWFKRTALGATQYLHGADTASADAIYLNSSDKLCIDIAGTNRLISTKVFRDPSAHYGMLVVFDAANGTPANRLRVYLADLASSELTGWDTDTRSGITTGTAKTMHNSIQHVIGKNPTAASNYFDGMISEHRIGTWSSTAPVLTDHCTLHPRTGQWRPKTYSGSYGTLGSRADFSDGSAATAAAIGADRSGNGNNWTPTNISVTAGVGCDWLTDTPTNNYATIDRLWPHPSGITISNGNLDVTTTPGANNETVVCSPIPTEDVALYWEVTQVGGNGMVVGIGRNLVPADLSTDIKTGQGWLVGNGNKYNNGTTAYGTAFATNEVAMVAYKRVGNTWSMWVGKQGTWFGSGDPVAGTNPTFSGTWSAGDQIYPVIVDEWTSANISAAINFGQRTFAYTAPTGFKTLGTKNYSQASSVIVSGTFTGNANADGARVPMNGTPTTMTINSNAVTFGTHADALADGVKLRTSSASYNTAGSNTWTATIVSNIKNIFRHQNARAN